MRWLAVEKFNANWIGEPNSGCWLWFGANRDDAKKKVPRYGVIWTGSERIGAHRFSWEVHRGPIPNGLQVLHRCDTPACVNPNHLFLGTDADNKADMVAKGRAPKPPSRLGLHGTHGALGLRSISRGGLTEEQVVEIATAERWRGMNIAFARRFNVSVDTVAQIRHLYFQDAPFKAAINAWVAHFRSTLSRAEALQNRGGGSFLCVEQSFDNSAFSQRTRHPKTVGPEKHRMRTRSFIGGHHVRAG